MRSWQLQETKARLSEVIKMAKQEGPQRITVHGAPEAMIMSSKEYERLSKPKESFVEFMRQSPLCGTAVDITRVQTPTRETDLA